MSATTDQQLAAADRRAVMRHMRHPDMKTDGNGVAIFLEPRRKRAHIVIHDGKGNAGKWSSSSFGAWHWKKIRDGVIDMQELTPDLPADQVTALEFLAKTPGQVIDIVSPVLARSLRDLEKDWPHFVGICNAPATKDNFKPYFAAIITSAGRDALKALKKGGK